LRRDPHGLTPAAQQQREALVQRLPRWRPRHAFRLRLQKIWDTARDRRQAQRAWLALCVDQLAYAPAGEGCRGTCARWPAAILKDVEDRQTRGPVAGRNTKARVIRKRS